MNKLSHYADTLAAQTNTGTCGRSRRHTHAKNRKERAADKVHTYMYIYIRLCRYVYVRTEVQAYRRSYVYRAHTHTAAFTHTTNTKHVMTTGTNMSHNLLGNRGLKPKRNRAGCDGLREGWRGGGGGSSIPDWEESKERMYARNVTVIRSLFQSYLVFFTFMRCLRKAV